MASMTESGDRTVASVPQPHNTVALHYTLRRGNGASMVPDPSEWTVRYRNSHKSSCARRTPCVGIPPPETSAY